MALRRGERPLDEWLVSLADYAASRSGGANPDNGAVLRDAARAIGEMFPDRRPMVIVTNGHDMDPVVGEVLDMREQVQDVLPDLLDRMDDLVRLLRGQLHIPLADAEAKVAGA